MTVTITASTRPAWKQWINTDDVNDPEVERRMVAIAQLEVRRTTVQRFEVIAINDEGLTNRLICDRMADRKSTRLNSSHWE